MNNKDKIYISHRGNLDGPNINLENTPRQIITAILLGYDCEVDIWVINESIYLGHDYPKIPISIYFLKEYKEKLWIHCKNEDALFYCKENCQGMNYFFHDKDVYTITSKGYIWGNINSKISKNSICVMPEKYDCNLILTSHELKSEGICSDYIKKIKERNK